jgi:hypothetical protein
MEDPRRPGCAGQKPGFSREKGNVGTRRDGEIKQEEENVLV